MPSHPIQNLGKYSLGGFTPTITPDSQNIPSETRDVKRTLSGMGINLPIVGPIGIGAFLVGAAILFLVLRR